MFVYSNVTEWKKLLCSFETAINKRLISITFFYNQLQIFFCIDAHEPDVKALIRNKIVLKYKNIRFSNKKNITKKLTTHNFTRTYLHTYV